MGLTIRIEDTLCIPGDVVDFDSFRRWALSEDFPEKGRIDFLQGALEIDMTAEELQSHGALKSELARWILERNSAEDLGQVFLDCARFNCKRAGLSCEPDMVLVSWKALQEGRTSYGQGPDRFVEIVGSLDLVVEVVSESSVTKDTRRLPPLYAQAGVRELWLADGRKSELSFEVWHLAEDGYRKSPVDTDGFQISKVMGRQVRLSRTPGPFPKTWRYRMEDR